MFNIIFRLISPEIQIVVLVLVSFLLSRRIVSAKDDGTTWICTVIYLSLVFCWKMIQESIELSFYHLVAKSSSWLPSWVMSADVSMWVAIFGLLLWIEVIIINYKKEKKDGRRTYIKLAILFLIEILLVVGVVCIERMKMFY